MCGGYHIPHEACDVSFDERPTSKESGVPQLCVPEPSCGNPLIPDLWRQALKPMTIKELGPVASTSCLFLEEYLGKLADLEAPYVEAAVQHWGHPLLHRITTVLLDCLEGKGCPSLLPADPYNTSVAAAFKPDGSIIRDTKGNLRWCCHFKTDPVVMIARSERSAQGDVSIQISSKIVHLDLIEVGPSGSASVVGYAADMGSIPCLVGLLIFILRAVGATGSNGRAFVGALAINVSDRHAKFTLTDLEELFSPLLSLVACYVTLRGGNRSWPDDRPLWFRAVRPFDGSARSVVLRHVPWGLDWPAFRIPTQCVLKVGGCLLSRSRRSSS
eukprot:jgi/Botrbrau1/12368/Bobra.0239s0017.1